MTPSDKCYAIIRKYEGLRLQAYYCPAGIPTIGYGHTAGVQMGDTCTPEQADVWLEQDVAGAARDVSRVVAVPITQNQCDALVSFVFNVGAGKFYTSTLRAKLNAGDDVGAAAEFPKWCHANGTVEPGLLARRNEEQSLFESTT